MKLDLVSSGSMIENQIIQGLQCNFETFHTAEKIAILHSYMAVHPLHFAKMAIILRSLSGISAAVISHVSTSTPSLDESQPSVNQSDSSQDILKHLNTYVIHILFNSLCQCMTGTSEADAIQKLKLWHKTYINITTLPSFDTKHTTDVVLSTGTADVQLPRAQLNVMKTIFALLQLRPDYCNDVFDIGHKVFTTLLTQNFTTNGQVRMKCV